MALEENELSVLGEGDTELLLVDVLMP
jgi:hypothetical protein